ncbi:GNAT family N-acetyltransferase [Clostridium manihotivorum]|uniref:GNAT family N-acetyltransferase n=1 Tax=Clostridium manihotivorum TaxID=2320868 RepID=UPI0013E31163|nr:GNAT family N-acetyltransferase [Clostridium manihotivorum]
MLTYRFADDFDVKLLASLRLDFLELVPTDDEYYEIRENLKDYYKAKLSTGQCAVMLAEDDAAIIGNGILSFYDTVPSIDNRTGKCGYIESIYVHPDYRRQKIGTLILTKLVEFAREKECLAIILNATDDSKDLYSRHGFKSKDNYMIYEIPNKMLTKNVDPVHPNYVDI